MAAFPNVSNGAPLSSYSLAQAPGGQSPVSLKSAGPSVGRAGRILCILLEGGFSVPCKCLIFQLREKKKNQIYSVPLRGGGMVVSTMLKEAGTEGFWESHPYNSSSQPTRSPELSTFYNWCPALRNTVNMLSE